MKERFESCIREMILRDRNHPSVAIWGMLNETKEGPVFREAVSALPLVRSLDETRLVLLSSGRWDGQLYVGSVSNPGSSEWESTWGEEAPGAPVVAMQYPSGVGVGDFHLYPTVPQTPEINHLMRTLGAEQQTRLPLRIWHWQHDERDPRSPDVRASRHTGRTLRTLF